ncbi:NB-ARC domain-containing protein, partial [Dapis sp. BLCC M126]|uniref:NB-ARC domain-containing protein n=1 Tax=Dapis sp. BLCC M126 TaxID=3400189 RepID=UPI003CF9EC1A
MVTAIHGLGAVGKSTLAQALAYDEEVQSRFSDGILWVTLGQEPNILPMLSGWVQTLGDYNFKSTSVEATADHLRTLLSKKSVLLVVDDAWSPDHAQFFNVGGSRCQVLVTTRNKAIARPLGAEIYSLDVMTLSQSMQLLSQILGREIRGEEAKQAEALVKELGYLPLALELAAAQVAEDDMSWGELLEDIQGEIARLKTLAIPGAEDAVNEANLKKSSLTASLNLSVKRLTQKRREDFIWLGILPDDVNITPGMATVLWGMNDEIDATKQLRYLRSQALLLNGVALPDGKPTYRLHDLFHDLARYLLTAPLHPTEEGDLPGLGIRLAKAHKIFLKKYRKLTDNHLWHTLPNDGYIHQHLVWHLEKAGKIEEIHGLLAEESKSGTNGWYETCELLGQMGIFITDVARAWELAVDLDEGRLSQVVSLQCRYALITASINSLAANLPGNLLVALVKHNFWTPEQGLAYALQKPEPRDKGDSLAKLVDYLPDSLKKAFSEVLATARQIKDERYYRVQLPQLTPAQALAVTRQIQCEEHRAEFLRAWADKFPEILPEVLAAARQIEDEYHRAQLLSALADKLTPEILPEALAAARQIYSEEYRAQVLSVLADKSPKILPEALAAARQIQDEYQSAEFLRAWADKFPEILPEVLAAARQIEDEYHRAQLLSALADKLTPEILPEALTAARQIQSEYPRARVLRALADKFPEILPEALAAARQIQSEYYRARVLGALVDKFPEILPEALAAARQIQYQENRAEVLNALADKLTPELLPEALAAARQIQSEYYRARVLRALADKLPEILPEALAAARQIQYQENRAQLLSALADKLTPELLPEALAAARQ